VEPPGKPIAHTQAGVQQLATQQLQFISHSVLTERCGKKQINNQRLTWLAAAQGRFLALCGFGNLPGDITFLDKKADGKCKVISQVRCSTSIAELRAI